MNRAIFRALVLAVLVAVAAACAFFANRAFSPRAREPGTWSRAVAASEHADRTRALLPALRLRQEAIGLFDELAGSGPDASRSKARLLAALLHVRNASAQPDSRQPLALAVVELRGAVRLDRGNDDAAYDLELLLARSARTGQPIGKPKREKQRSVGQAGTGTPGTGY